MRVTLALARNFPQIQQDVPFIERKSRYWTEAREGLKDIELFAKATATAWRWAEMSQ